MSEIELQSHRQLDNGESRCTEPEFGRELLDGIGLRQTTVGRQPITCSIVPDHPAIEAS